MNHFFCEPVLQNLSPLKGGGVVNITGPQPLFHIPASFARRLEYKAMQLALQSVDTHHGFCEQKKEATCSLLLQQIAAILINLQEPVTCS